jgi:hypothetical protein
MVEAWVRKDAHLMSDQHHSHRPLANFMRPTRRSIIFNRNMPAAMGILMPPNLLELF